VFYSCFIANNQEGNKKKIVSIITIIVKTHYIHGVVVIAIMVGKFITFTFPCYYIYGQIFKKFLLRFILLHLRLKFITFYGYLQFYYIYWSYTWKCKLVSLLGSHSI